MADSLRRFSRSAPVKPDVECAISLRFTSSARGLFLAWTLRISSLPLTSGVPTATFLSNLPGLIIAGSRMSTLLVAAITITPSFIPKPSISTRSWLRVCSLSSWPPPIPVPRRLATASISSIKTIQGLFFLASSNKSLTLDAPTPTNISTKSEPEMLKKGTFASPATALARSVLPVPGGPSKRTPLGILAPTLVNFPGFLRKSTISSRASFSSSRPATSLKVTSPSPTIMRALDLPKFIILALVLPPAAWPFIIRRMKMAKIPTTRMGNMWLRNQLSRSISVTVVLMPASVAMASISVTSVAYSVYVSPPKMFMIAFPVGASLLGQIVTLLTLLSSIYCANSALVHSTSF